MKPIRGFLRNLQARIARRFFRREQRPFFYEQELDTDGTSPATFIWESGIPEGGYQSDA